ncbi:hypothetical protein B0H12DRAFT_1109081 [Mycena haematopus]|nr:hypothetical protein B0H12DRAFT_1109081 [Mycena haematopus]
MCSVLHQQDHKSRVILCSRTRATRPFCTFLGLSGNKFCADQYPGAPHSTLH